MIENINRGIEENALVALNKYDIQKDFNKKIQPVNSPANRKKRFPK